MSFAAYNINRQYYKNLHYMWCTPFFSGDFKSPHYTVPPTSSPLDIYKQLQGEIMNADQHAHKIKALRVGIRRGAQVMAQRGKITASQMNDIFFMAKRLDKVMFRPLLCVISRLEAVPHYKAVPIGDKANALSHEYILADLPQSAFDVISIG